MFTTSIYQNGLCILIFGIICCVIPSKLASKIVDDMKWIICVVEKTLGYIGAFVTVVVLGVLLIYAAKRYGEKKSTKEENPGRREHVRELQPHEEFVVREFEKARNLLKSGQREEAMQHLVNAVEVKVLPKPYDMLKLLSLHLSPSLFEMLCVRLHISRRDKGCRRVR